MLIGNNYSLVVVAVFAVVHLAGCVPIFDFLYDNDWYDDSEEGEDMKASPSDGISIVNKLSVHITGNPAREGQGPEYYPGSLGAAPGSSDSVTPLLATSPTASTPGP